MSPCSLSSLSLVERIHRSSTPISLQHEPREQLLALLRHLPQLFDGLVDDFAHTRVITRFTPDACAAVISIPSTYTAMDNSQ